MAMELLVDVFKLDKSRLYATYFEGYEKNNLEPDNETKELWKKQLVEFYEFNTLLNKIEPFIFCQVFQKIILSKVI